MSRLRRKPAPPAPEPAVTDPMVALERYADSVALLGGMRARLIDAGFSELAAENLILMQFQAGVLSVARADS